VPAYALLVASGGPKLKVAEADAAIPGQPNGKNGSSARITGSGDNKTISGAVRGGPFGDFKLTSANGVLHFQFATMNMKGLSQYLSQGLVGLPVVDMTNLNGAYEVQLDISNADMLAANSPPPATADGSASDPSGGSVAASLQKLGLKLEKRKAPIERLIIDHAEKTPTEN
jgi:uncharacterized protein (TIGR03435 family)